MADEYFASKEGIFNKRLVAGAMVFSYGLGLVATNCVNSFSYGYDRLRFIKPVFIVETKNLSGWIFGTDKQSTWTQVIYKSKHKFQNPLRQTYRHKKVLSKYLRIKEIYIHQVISFVGDCQFKSVLPPIVIHSGLGSYIKQFITKVFSIGKREFYDDYAHHPTEIKAVINSAKEVYNCLL